MKVEDILDDFDRAIQTRVLQLFVGNFHEKARDFILAAIKQGREDFWDDYLPILLSDKDAAQCAKEKFLAMDL